MCGISRFVFKDGREMDNLCPATTKRHGERGLVHESLLLRYLSDLKPHSAQCLAQEFVPFASHAEIGERVICRCDAYLTCRYVGVLVRT